MNLKIHPPWLLLLTLLFVSTALFAYTCTKQVYRHYLFDQTQEVEGIQMNLLRFAENELSLEASYSFRVNHMLYYGKYKFSDKIYPNAWAAKTAKDILEKRKWEVHYQRDQPNNSTLENPFPTKECINFLLLFSLLLYFFSLSRHYSSDI